MNESEAAVRVLVCGVNWLGDAIMSMPALQAFRAAHPNVHLTLLSKPPSLEQIENLTYSTSTDAQRKENRQSWNKWDVIATVGVLGLVLAMYLYFSFWLR